MNIVDVLRSGHQNVVDAVEDLPPAVWEAPGACGEWSVKDVIAHLASFEATLVDILRQVKDKHADTPTLDRFFSDPANFNTLEVQARRDKSPQTIREEYAAHYQEAARLLESLPIDQRRQNGLLAWYGEAYDLEDFLIYTYYGHKREHTAQILAQRERIAPTETTAQ